MLRNVASQKWRVYAYDRTDGSPKTGDAANISAYITADDATPAATNDAAPTEASSTNEPGYYDFDLTQAETNAAKVTLSPKSSTADITVIACPPVVYTKPANFSELAITATTGLVSVADKTGFSLSSGGLAAIAAWTVDITGSLSGAVGSVSGAVGSVTGNVGGNVSGSVGSVLGVTFPTNFSDLAITVTTGRVTVGTNNDKTDYALSSAQVTALVAAIEAEIADDATGEAVKQAIIDKLIENLPDLDDLTLGAIATSVWAHATRTLTSGLLDAAGIRSALGMSTANMDTQLAAISTAITDAESAILAEGASSWTTAVGFSTVTTSDILTQAAAALVAIHLDHLFANTYDPASKPGAADALLNELVESDSGVARFTANALEQAPSGGGGGGSGTATIENQEAILSAISTVQTTVSGASITVVSPISEDGQTLTIVRGDDYLNANGRAITFSSTAWPDLTGATFLFAAEKNGATDFVGTVTGTSVGGATQTVRLELPTAQTSLASVSPLGSPYKWDIEATLSDGAIVTIARGIAVVIEDHA